MKQPFDLQQHIAQGVEAIVADTLRATLKNPKESAFMAKFALASRRATQIRLQHEGGGPARARFPDRQHHQPLQPALRGLLFPLQQRHRGRGAGGAAQ